MSESKNTSTASADAGASFGLKRRTILTGAAWTVPIMVASTATPAFAASNDLTLKFDKSSYSGQACGTITGAKVTATRNGTAVPGVSVTVSLSDGYTFSGGSTSYTGTSGTDGSVSLPDINVPGAGGDGTLSATGGGASATATATAPKTGSALVEVWRSGQPPQHGSQGGVPAGATPLVGGWYWQSGTTIYRNNGSIAATNVDKVSANFTDWGSNNQKMLAWSDSAGNLHSEVWGGGGQPSQNSQGGVPAGSTPLVGGWYWQSGTTIYRNNGSIAATNVDKVDAVFNNWGSDNQKDLAWTDLDGNTYCEVWGGAGRPSQNAQGGVPSGSTPLAGGYYWQSAGTVYRNDGSIMDTNVNKIDVVKNNWGTANQENVGYTRKSSC